MAVIGILPLFSFFTFNVCEVANSNVIFVKNQTQLALDTQDFQMSRYHAFKAISGIWKAQYSFSECECDGLATNMDLAAKNLKEATKALTLEDQKVFLKIAMQNTVIGMTAIEGRHKTGKRNTIQNETIEAAKTVDTSRKLVEETYLKQIEEALSKFENSLNNVVALEDCQNAYKFIRAMQDETHEKLGKKNLTNRKIYYLTRVVEITNAALLKINSDCSSLSLTGK
ncbi:MAG: hypothetical protein ED555_08235 [Allomuricauda sp.]|nr:MAG: hypothetical protein ED555_08235 [Allomuricauda sp.]